jgi:hypothetical protein
MPHGGIPNRVLMRPTASSAHRCGRRSRMADLIFLSLGSAGFLALVAYAYLCKRL